MCMGVLPHVCLGTLCMQCMWNLEEGIRFLDLEFADSYELPCECWGLNLGPL